MTDASPPAVILLRSANDPDPYVRALAEAGLRAQCRPVLRFAFPADTALREHLRAEPRYAGLVATSPRAARALRRVFDETGTLHAAWDGAPAYVVGPKTADRFRALGFDVRGEDAGEAEALASYIVDHDPPGSLLFLSGNRRRDTLPEGLRAAGVPFDELVVYESHLRTDLSLPPPEEGVWLVFFSPLGLRALREAGSGPLDPYHCAAIGPTTAAALREEGVPVQAVAETPSPEALVRALVVARSGGAPRERG